MGVGMYSSPTRSSKVKRVMDLAMSNEEKILRQNYGPNVENFINQIPQHGRYMSQSIGSKSIKSQGALQYSRDLQFTNQNNKGNGSNLMDLKSSPYNIVQKQQQNQQKWNEILKNKESNLQQKHKRLREQMTRKQKFEEEANKKLKEKKAVKEHFIDKKHEKYASTMVRQNQLKD